MQFYGKDCEFCGHFFKPARKDGRFCSQSCKQKAYRRRVDPDVGSISREKQRKANIDLTKHTKTKELCCEQCGRTLIVSIATTNLAYCSNACKQKAYRKRKALL